MPGLSYLDIPFFYGDLLTLVEDACSVLYLFNTNYIERILVTVSGGERLIWQFNRLI